MKFKFSDGHLISVLMVVGSMFSLTIGGSMAKSLFPAMGPVGTTFLRLGIASLILIALRRPWRTTLNRRQWAWTATYGVTLGFMNMFFYLAIARLPIALAIGVEFMGPLTLAVCLSQNARDIFWAVLALIGIVLILPQTHTASADLIGIGFSLCAAAFWAAYIVVGRKIGGFVPTAHATAYGTGIGALLIAPFGLAPAMALWDHPALIPFAICVGIFSSAIPYTLEISAMKRLDPKTFGILLSLEPAVGALSAFLLLGERLTPIQGLAVSCVIAASVGSTLSSRRSTKPQLMADVVAS